MNKINQLNVFLVAIQIWFVINLTYFNSDQIRIISGHFYPFAILLLCSPFLIVNLLKLNYEKKKSLNILIGMYCLLMDFIFKLLV